MRQKEQRLWDSMRRHKPKGFYMKRIEDGIGSGFPDVFIRNPIGEFCLVELKAPTVPKKEETRLLGTEGLNVEQVNFHFAMAATSSGTARCWTLIRDSEQGLYLINARHARYINDATRTELREMSDAATWADIFITLRY